jgi:hypothetical protein
MARLRITGAKAARVDLDVGTERRGSSYSLICRKNRASYERRDAQRRHLADVAILKGATGRGGVGQN